MIGSVHKRTAFTTRTGAPAAKDFSLVDRDKLCNGH